ncbi:choline/glycine/proline betaine transport protein [Desulfitobacterium sp. LBE]|nr:MULTISPECIES: BCCT family transporter [Desulfitobacterium]ACL22329.1 choline/carnitine/betaine transporter [Desulfitobacterium hafniense DCB-2]EHL04515.1 transporter, betaine/carnitine/choline family [Desulfitobacterium hafniense DP7]KTE92147.1 glycine/betaine ABC transporter permease [Desulfitobacterium hafniense]MEA5021433.1 BCCT family transporter [Desulfitobacterium hafniense]TWH59898.1 choline/glycine/proline betaine transport protein [Desulfitobacterium sp. LBE]
MGVDKKQNTVLYISSAIALLFVLWGVFLPENMANVVNKVFALLTTNFGWLYLLAVAIFIIFVFGIAISRYGKIKLGADDDKPEFSNFQWFAMLFGGGMGIGLVFWSVAEPIMHFNSPPFGEPGTVEAMQTSMRVVFFHWGIHAWVNFAIAGLALAYFQFRKGLPFLISSAFYPLIGDRIYGPIGKAIDILAVFATIFGIATSLGLGSSQIATGIQYIWGIPAGPLTISLVIAVITVIFTLATVSGLHKAMQSIANVKVWLSVAFMVFIFYFGGKVFILNTFTQSLGDYLQNFVGQTFWMANESWVGGWTIFYWAWWIAWAPFVGQFVARVSKGRTIREFVFAVTLLPVGFSFIWLAIYGGAAFNLDQISGGFIQNAVNADYTTALFALLQQMPLYAITGPLAILLIVTCFVGAADSATYVLAMLTSNGDMDPSKKLRSFWGIMQGAMTIVLIVVGGTAALKALQTASIASAFPFMLIMLVMCYSILKALRSDHP